jgi:RecA-family ATPase
VGIKDIFQYQTVEHLAGQIRQGELKQAEWADVRQMAKKLMDERSQFSEKDVEVII